ncbi:hypothetical protein GH5_07426 [Leishmania sp. Ghana 2012 LV757]|uniref:hypothetical protein n=1 Tax=Leishmania sp. Ghana 2012 LV757 TaxID=2803181 RepID=UPI001B697E5C|nr:hypothetical protein GH5_07426 [Leishmania sp. Ghana 2012 LV757]
MSSSSSAPQREQQPWTFSAYHVVLTKFVSALQAEVRRQQDAYDHAVETLHASADAGSTDNALELGVPPYATHEEQVQILRDTYALATLDTGALVSLGPYRLLHTLKAHMTRIEDERRAGAVAAGNGIGGRKRRLGRDALVLKSERGIDTAALDGGEGSQAPQHHGMTPLPVRIKAERSDDDKLDGVAQQQPCVGNRSPIASLSSSSTAATPAPLSAMTEHRSTKGTTVSSAGGAGAGDLSGGCPPSWITLKKEAEKLPPSSEIYNGAYFVPHATPTGAPIPRYVSSSTRSLSANNAAPLPTLVAPVSCTTKVRSSGTRKKLPAPLLSKAPKRCRSVSTSQATAAAADEAPLLSRVQRAKITRVQERMQFCDQAPSASSPSKGNGEGDPVLRLWWRVWPNSSPTMLANSEENGRRQCAAAAPPPAPHMRVRPTPTIVSALIRVAEQNYKRDCERCVAQRTYLAALLEKATSWWGSSSAAGTAGSRNAEQAALVTSPELPHPEALRQLQDELACKQAKVDSAYAKRLSLFRRLTEALQDEPGVCVGGAMAPEAGEAGHAAPSSTPHAQHRAASPPGDQKRCRRSTSTRPPTRASTAIDIEALEDDRGEKLEADSHTAAKNAAAEACAVELLHSSLTDPISLLRHVCKARGSPVFSSSETAAEALTPAPCLQATSEEHWDLPNGIVGIDLPSLEHDRNAPELAEYLWPEDLDTRIRHELRGVVSAKSHNPDARSVHVVLSAAQVRRLEEAARAVSTVDPASQIRLAVPPVVNGSIMAHPKFLESGWLYVHGRGETVVAGVELN